MLDSSIRRPADGRQHGRPNSPGRSRCAVRPIHSCRTDRAIRLRRASSGSAEPSTSFNKLPDWATAHRVPGDVMVVQSVRAHASSTWLLPHHPSSHAHHEDAPFQTRANTRQCKLRGSPRICRRHHMTAAVAASRIAAMCPPTGAYSP